MKNILFIIVILFLIINGCYILPELADWEIPKEFKTIDEALNYVGSYDYKDDGSNDWALPEETYKRGWGSCADLSLLLAHIFYEKLNYKDTIVIWGYYNNEIEMINGDHAWVALNNKWYESVWGYEIIDREFYTPNRFFEYEDALRKAMNN